MHWAFWLAGGLVALFLIDRLLLWIECKGWLYYRKRRPERDAHSVGLAFLEMYNLTSLFLLLLPRVAASGPLGALAN